ncbi:hypothetical protein [Dactylosporangium sp. NPDC000521]|uniref:hypothetical protein n=1 Tax=Dactylosporangium sp. NPDC000521 TaxID=3363975 RepID=UPI0036B21F9F
MNGDRQQQSTVRLPILLTRPSRRLAPWHAELDVGPADVHGAWRVQGENAAEARRALAQLLTAALARMGQGPVVVIGGSDYYANCVHLILPESHGWVVRVVRDGRYATSWSSSHERDRVMRQVLDHVGGQPVVVVF